MEVDVPVGFRFRPRDVELLLPHLKSKVDGRPLTVPIPIPTLNVYDTDPWSLPPGFQGDDGFFYCFTQLRRCSDKDRRVKRSVGSSGTWYTNNTTVVTGVGGEVVGYRTFLSYQVKKKNTGWVMYEYRLKEDSPTSSSSSWRLHEDVICKIKNGSKKQPQELELEVLEGPGHGKRKRVEEDDPGGCYSGNTVDDGSSPSLQLSTSPESLILVEEGREGVPTGGTGSSSFGYCMDHLEGFRWREPVQLCEGDDRFYFSPDELLQLSDGDDRSPKEPGELQQQGDRCGSSWIKELEEWLMRDGDDSDVVGPLQPSTSPEGGVPGMDETFTFPSSVEQQGSGGVRPGDGDDHIFSSLESLGPLPLLGDGDDCVVLGSHCLTPSTSPEPLHVTVQEMIPSMDEMFDF